MGHGTIYRQVPKELEEEGRWGGGSSLPGPLNLSTFFLDPQALSGLSSHGWFHDRYGTCGSGVLLPPSLQAQPDESIWEVEASWEEEDLE